MQFIYYARIIDTYNFSLYTVIINKYTLIKRYKI